MKDAFLEDNSEKPKAEQYIGKPEKKQTTEKKGGRRGVWKRVRVRPADGFETAESQNIGNQFLNSLDKDQKQERTKNFSYEYHETVEDEKKNENLNKHEATNEDSQTSESSTIAPESTTVVPTKIIDEEVPVVPTDEIYSDADSTEMPESIEVESAPVQEKKSELIEVAKKALTELFHYASEIDNEDDVSSATTEENDFNDNEYSTSTTFAPEILTTTTEQPQISEKVESTQVKEQKSKSSKPGLVATSTSTEISHETEICYRGRCIKTDKTKK